MQYAFHAGEFAPALNARVDMAKYHSAAALLQNFYPDYRGGASSRPGTKYILQAKKSSTNVRLITFQASFTVGYAIEVGDFYMRFYNNGAPVLETAKTIIDATKANPAAIGSIAHGYSVGDVIYITGVGGMTQLNGRYFIVKAAVADAITLTDLNGVNVNSTAYSTYTSGGTMQRVYTIASPYASADLATLKTAQSVNTMVICHPSYVPYVLTLVSATNWTLNPIVFGATIAAPTGVGVASTLAAGAYNYSYVVTAVDANGQESAAGTPVALASKEDIRSIPGTNRITWTARSGAASYNVYKAEVSNTNAVAAGAMYGYIGNCTGVTFDDSNIGQDFSITPPIAKNPFQGAGLASVTITTAGAYTTPPTATLAAAPAGGATATIQPVLGVTVAAIVGANPGFAVGDILVFSVSTWGNVQLRVSAIDGATNITAVDIVGVGSVVSGSTPANPVTMFKASVGTPSAVFVLTWGVTSAIVTNAGAGYTSVPAITFSAGAAAATAVLATASAGNPGVPSFFQQRLCLAGLTQAPQSFYMSQPGSPYNFNVSNPIQADDAIGAAIVSGQLNTIKSMTSMPTGLMTLSDKAAWLINGGSGQEGISPINVVAHAHSYNGSSDVPPIVANFDILYVQAKGSVVRDLTYNFYANIFTGTDISVLSSHLFFSYQITGWAWAEEPFKVVWAIRDDGTMLSLTFMKEQELIGWAHSVTDGLFKSNCVVTEAITDFGSVDALYVVVERTINGFTVKYIERMAERDLTSGATYAWCVDAGLRYNGAPATAFTGGEHLAGETIVGLADGVPITPFVMAANGAFTLPSASVVTVGLSFLPRLQTLGLDLGEPTIQGKRKKITGVTVRVQDTLGLTIGKTFDATSQTVMKDLVIGNINAAANAVVTGLVTGDARTIIDPTWDEPGQYCIEQPQPYPVTILGVIPEIVLGDTVSEKRDR